MQTKEIFKSKYCCNVLNRSINRFPCDSLFDIENFGEIFENIFNQDNIPSPNFNSVINSYTTSSLNVFEWIAMNKC
jgi:hypothetical protein